jgi:hypothetical protein
LFLLADVADVYCIDTSALIDLPRNYPRASFAAVWARLAALVAEGRLISPREVYRELSKKEDQVFAWAGENTAMFSDPDDEQQRLLREILTKYRAWVDPATDRPVADPLVIAMAKAKRQMGVDCWVIVHEEIKGAGATRIPNVCREYEVPYLRVPDVIVTEGWSFA